MSLASALQAFVAIFPAELPDKTMIATIVLVTRFRSPVLVWLGAAGAFAVHVTIAVTAGGLLGAAPDAMVRAVTTLLFLAGAVLLWRSAGRHLEPDPELEGADQAAAAPTSPWPAIASSFGVVFVAEWGDLTQVATAGLAARTGDPLGVAAGALAALWTVAGLAVTAGRSLARRLPVSAMQRVAACVFATLAIVTAVGGV